MRATFCGRRHALYRQLDECLPVGFGGPTSPIFECLVEDAPEASKG